jgi:hypothetical protein
MLVDIIGSGFGVFSISPVAKTGASSSERSEWVSSTALQCWVARGTDRGSSQHAVTAAGQSGLSSDVFSYDAPEISIMRVDPRTPVTSELGGCLSLARTHAHTLCVSVCLSLCLSLSTRL